MRLVKWFLARPVVLCAFLFAVQVVRRQWSERAFGNDSALDIPTEALQVFRFDYLFVIRLLASRLFLTLQVNQSALLDAEAKADSVTVALVSLRVFSFFVHAFRLLLRLLPRPARPQAAKEEKAARPQAAKEVSLVTTAEYRATRKRCVSRERGPLAEAKPTRPRSRKGWPTFPLFLAPRCCVAPIGSIAGTASKVRKLRG